MRNIYVAAFAITVLCVLFYLVKAHRNKKHIARQIERMQFAAAFTVIASMVQIASTDRLVCSISYAFFFLGTDWVLYFLYRFLQELCFYENKQGKAGKIIQLIIMVDNFCLLVNPLAEHMYTCREKYENGVELFYQYDMKPLFYIHLAIVYILVLLCLGILIRKTIQLPKVFRFRYLGVFIFSAVVASADVYHVIFDTVIDYMVIGFAIGSMAMYYFALIYAPTKFLNRVLGNIVMKMKDGMMVFDTDYKCVFINPCFNKFFPFTIENEELGKEGESTYRHFLDWCWEREIVFAKDFDYDEVVEKNGKKFYFRVEYRILKDEKDRVMGSCIRVQDRTEEMENLLKERYRATHDVLTGLYNREHYFEKTQELLLKNKKEEYVLLCSDIRDFKLINDLFGIERGDDVLRQQADFMRRQAGKESTYGRISGDKFSMCIPKKEFHEEIFIEGIRSMGDGFVDSPYRMHIYLGVCEIERNTDPVNVLVDKALMAINTIKGDYEKVVAYYDSEIIEKNLHDSQILNEFERAVKRDEFEMFLQAQSRVDGTIIGAEGLARWRHPVKGLVPPIEFIPVLERAGLVHRLDSIVWEKAAQQLRIWKDRGRDDLSISVNISTKDMYNLDLYATFTRLVEQYGIDPHNLKLEITESTLVKDVESSKKIVDRLRSYGFIIEIDDFGVGYSSLNTLKDLHADVVKIDMGFLRETENAKKSRIILDMVIKLCRNLTMDVVTEGIETKEQLESVHEMGCDVFQGYYFSKPVSVKEFEERYGL